MSGKSTSVNALFSDLKSAETSGNQATVGSIVDALGHRGFGPLLLVPALIELSPIGGIPGVPTLLAVIILLFAAQLAIGRRYPWLPDVLETRSIPAEKLEKALAKLQPVADWLDKWFHERMARFIDSTTVRVAAVIVILLCLTVPPLEVIPFASTAPMVAIAMVGLAMTVRDGVLMLAAFAAAATGVALAFLA